MFSYQLIRSKRRTISVIVNSFGEIIVRAPNNCPEKAIEEFINTNSDWINSKINIASSTMPDIVNLKKLNYIYFLGQKYNIIQVNTKKITLDINENILYLPDVEKKEIKLINWFKKNAVTFFTKRCAELFTRTESIIENKFIDIKIINSKTKWGACDSNKIIYFNWRAIMLEPVLIDYLIYHEFCHLRYLNHSKDYWKLAAQLTDYKKHRKQLKEKNYLILLYR